MRVAIVGSRRRRCEREVCSLVRSLPADTVVISGGARGVDSWAVAEAKRRGLQTTVYRPIKQGPGYGFACRALTERNRRIAEAVDRLYAFPAEDRKGGTEQTIKFAQRLGVEVVLL